MCEADPRRLRRKSIFAGAAFMHSLRTTLCTRPPSMYEGRVLLKQRKVLVLRRVEEACLDLAGGRPKTYTGDARSEIVSDGPHIQVGERGKKKGEWMQRINIKKIRRDVRCRATPSSEVQLGVFESAGSRPVIVRLWKDPRTRRPDAFTANCPHRDSGMEESRC